MTPQLLTLFGDDPQYYRHEDIDYPSAYMGGWRQSLAKVVKGALSAIPGVGAVAKLLPERMLTIPARAVKVPSKPSEAQKAITGAIVQSALETAQPLLSKLSPAQQAAAQKSIASSAAVAAQDVTNPSSKYIMMGAAGLGLIALLALSKKRSA